MATLTVKELSQLRRKLSDSFKPETWLKQTLNAASQGAEDVLVAQGFDAASFVDEATTVNTRATNVKAALDAGNIPANLVPIVEDWLVEHPPSITRRFLDITALQTWLVANRALFNAAVQAMPADVRGAVVRNAVRRQVEAVI